MNGQAHTCQGSLAPHIHFWFGIILVQLITDKREKWFISFTSQQTPIHLVYKRTLIFANMLPPTFPLPLSPITTLRSLPFPLTWYPKCAMSLWTARVGVFGVYLVPLICHFPTDNRPPPTTPISCSQPFCSYAQWSSLASAQMLSQNIVAELASLACQFKHPCQPLLGWHSPFLLSHSWPSYPCKWTPQSPIYPS